MRITNTMITNSMRTNIGKNVRSVSRLYGQLSTGKTISYASEDPILAARALKFRTTVKETQQYQKNVQQGLSWMEVTETAVNGVESVLKRIRELAVQGSSDSYYNERDKINTEIRNLVDQLGVELNATYAGRYVFSGYRTDKPPILAKDSSSSYSISQNFSVKDLQTGDGYYKNPNPTKKDDDAILTEDVPMINLPYKDATNVELNGTSVPIYSLEDYDSNPYDFSNGNTCRYIKETGELIFAPGCKPTGDFTVTYDKTGLKKGEPNPEVYFNCTRDDGEIFTPANDKINYEFGVNTHLPVNLNATDVLSDNMYADLNNFVSFIDSIKVSNYEDLMLVPGMDDERAKAIISREEAIAKDAYQDRFSNLIKMIDTHTKNVSKEHADLGSQMNRLELIENRLDEDEITFSTLLSKNEDLDYMTAIMQLNSAESVYQASMQVGAKIIQITLADYIR